MDDTFTQVRCDECGEFYHKDAMRGRVCFNCVEEYEDDDEYNS